MVLVISQLQHCSQIHHHLNIVNCAQAQGTGTSAEPASALTQQHHKSEVASTAPASGSLAAWDQSVMPLVNAFVSSSAALGDKVTQFLFILIICCMISDVTLNWLLENHAEDMLSVQVSKAGSVVDRAFKVRLSFPALHLLAVPLFWLYARTLVSTLPPDHH